MIHLFARETENTTALTDRILRGDQNVHWIPVTRLYRGTETVNFIRFDSLKETWEGLFPNITLEHIHPNPGRPQWADIKKLLTEEQVEALKKYYEKDVEAYANAASRLPE